MKNKRRYFVKEVGEANELGPGLSSGYFYTGVIRAGNAILTSALDLGGLISTRPRPLAEVVALPTSTLKARYSCWSRFFHGISSRINRSYGSEIVSTRAYRIQ